MVLKEVKEEKEVMEEVDRPWEEVGRPWEEEGRPWEEVDRKGISYLRELGDKRLVGEDVQ